MTKQQTINTLKTQLPGFYSVEQVIEMISNIKDVGSAPFDVDEFKKQIEEAVKNAVENMNGGDVVDYDSAEFSLDGREITFDGIDVNTSDIVDNVMESVDYCFDRFFDDEEDDCGC